MKNRLDLNIELASPDDFIPAAADWREHSPLIASVGLLQFFHYDLSLQALAKLERSYAQDLADVRDLMRRGHVTPQRIRNRFAQIERQFVRYPAIDAQSFKKNVEGFLKGSPL